MTKNSIYICFSIDVFPKDNARDNFSFAWSVFPRSEAVTASHARSGSFEETVREAVQKTTYILCAFYEQKCNFFFLMYTNIYIFTRERPETDDLWKYFKRTIAEPLTKCLKIVFAYSCISAHSKHFFFIIFIKITYIFLADKGFAPLTDMSVFFWMAPLSVWDYGSPLAGASHLQDSHHCGRDTLQFKAAETSLR